MYKLVSKDSLALVYKAIGGDGLVKSKTVTLNNLSGLASEDDIYDTALLIKGLLMYSVEKVARRTETLYLED